MKGRLGEPALPKVKLVLAREQSLTEEHLGALESPSLVEEPSVGDEHVADPVGIADENDRLRSDADAGDVAVAVRELLEQRERPTDHGGPRAEAAARAGVARRGGESHAQTVFSSPRRRQNCT